MRNQRILLDIETDIFSIKSKLIWDKYSWFLGLLLGSLAGLLIFCGAYPKTRRFVENAFPYSAYGFYTGDLVLAVGLSAGLFVFPAVLAGKARRFYCIWGLPPIATVFLWLLTGFAIAHRMQYLFDPVWAFPLLSLVCWAIATFPISLFRWYRRRRIPTGLSTEASLPPRKNFLVPLAVAIVFLPLIFVGWHNLKYPKPLDIQFRANLSNNGVTTVPLIEKHGGIFVMALLDGQSQLCKIDTGSDTVNWQRELHIEGEMTQERGQVCDALDSCVSAATVKMREIKIGSYKVSGFPTEMMEDDSGLFSSVAAKPTDNTPLLGNSLFSLMVMTIDYQNKTLTIHTPTYDFTKQPRALTDKILEMGWTSHSEDSLTRQQIIGWPVIRAYVDGRPFWCMIDTGWEGPELGLTTAFFRQLPQSRQRTQKTVHGYFAHSVGTVHQLDSLSFQMPVLSHPALPVVLTGKGWIVKSLSGGDGIVGTALMRRYRITLDYPRRRVLLEPYALSVPNQPGE